MKMRPNGECSIINDTCPHFDEESPCGECSFLQKIEEYKSKARSLNAVECCSTKEIVRSLGMREGVKTEYAEPHQDKTITVNGPGNYFGCY